jgi:hypothetical protein
MIDTNSGSFLGAVLLIIFLALGIIFYFIFKKFTGKYLALIIVFGALGYLLNELRPWNYLFYLAGVVCLILFIINLLRKKKINEIK